MEWNGGRWIVGWCSGGGQKVFRSTTKSPPDTQKKLPNVGIIFLLMLTRLSTVVANEKQLPI